MVGIFDHLTQLEQARALGLVVWASLFLVLYQHKALYLGLCVLVVLVVGAVGLEYAPALWLPVQLIVSVMTIFQRVQGALTRKRKL